MKAMGINTKLVREIIKESNEVREAVYLHGRQVDMSIFMEKLRRHRDNTRRPFSIDISYRGHSIRVGHTDRWIIRVLGNKFDNSDWHPYITPAALDMLVRVENGEHSQDDIENYSDVVEVYKKLLIGDLHRAPIKFWSTLKDFEREMIMRYAVMYCMGYESKKDLVKIRTTDVKRYKLGTLLQSQQLGIMDLVHNIDHTVEPWEMIHAFRGIYNDMQVKMEALYCMCDDLNIRNIDHITSTAINKYCPGVKNGFAKMTDVKAEFLSWILRDEAKIRKSKPWIMDINHKDFVPSPMNIMMSNIFNSELLRTNPYIITEVAK